MHTPADFAPRIALPDPLPQDALAFAYADSRIVVGGTEDAPTLPTLADLAAAGLAGVPHYLGELGGAPCVAVLLGDKDEPPAPWRLAGLRALFFKLPEPLLALAARAFQVVEWDRTHRYCGRCGTPTEGKPDERAKVCPKCGYTAYPRVSPAMMALVTRGREILLARAQRFPATMYSALAGFVEPGETLEDCVRREVREEVGIEVDRITYFASQSWSFPHSLMVAFTAEYAGGELAPDGVEIVDARWYPVDALPHIPTSISIARRLIDATVARLRSP